MGKVTHLPPPGPDDPIFSEGFTLSAGRMARGPAASPESDADRESHEGEKLEDEDGTGEAAVGR